MDEDIKEEQNRERLVADILGDIAGHEQMVEIAKEEVRKAKGTVAFWEAHVCSHLTILRDLHKELSERTGEPYEEVQDDFHIDVDFSPLWHSKDERPEDDSIVLTVDDDGWGPSGMYYADCGYFAPAAGAKGYKWEESKMTRWAYVEDLLPKKETKHE